MKLSMKLIATALAAAIATGAAAQPASAFIFEPFKYLKSYKPHGKKSAHGGGSNAGAYVVGCVMGSALGLIGASIYKGRALGFQYRWMTQVEYEAYLRNRDRSIELTSDEAALIGFTCGLGAFPVMAKYNQR